MRPAVSAERERLRQLTAALKKNLEACAHDPEVEAVHNVRTGTRRIEAMLDTILREKSAGRLTPAVREISAAREKSGEDPQPDSNALTDSAQHWLRLLKKIRRTAATVRDLDVHRSLLKKRGLLMNTPASHPGEDAKPDSEAGLSDSVENPAGYSVGQQAENLDAWLTHARQEHAKPLMKAAPRWSARLDGELAAFEEAMQHASSSRRKTRSAAVVALESFARLSTQMERLDSGNLHDFRKGAKKARYMAESGGDDPRAGAVGKALKRLQDEIGDWHDWLVLAEEAHQALGERGVELTALIEAERNKHYALAMSTSERMRGRLMGEWQALSPVRRPRARPALNDAPEPHIP
ncbi:MAG TPA: CHAD domain-containing protein [Silvibacterium sp.]|nr:CHAD domain-containing protein [Silvibacterium sp.]